MAKPRILETRITLKPDGTYIVEHDYAHVTRKGNSPLYDLVCILCGATDNPIDDRLEEPCKGWEHQKEIDAIIKAEIQTP
jgi:hypothetical protein